MSVLYSVLKEWFEKNGMRTDWGMSVSIQCRKEEFWVVEIESWNRHRVSITYSVVDECFVKIENRKWWKNRLRNECFYSMQRGRSLSRNWMLEWKLSVLYFVQKEKFVRIVNSIWWNGEWKRIAEGVFLFKFE